MEDLPKGTTWAQQRKEKNKYAPAFHKQLQLTDGKDSKTIAVIQMASPKNIN